MSSTQKLNNAGEPLPDIGLKWSKTPKSQQEPDTTTNTTATTTVDDNSSSSPLKKSPYTPEEEAKLRAKGINPALKAEMDAATKGEGKRKSFWGKMAQTAMGGGWIK